MTAWQLTEPEYLDRPMALALKTLMPKVSPFPSLELSDETGLGVSRLHSALYRLRSAGLVVLSIEELEPVRGRRRRRYSWAVTDYGRRIAPGALAAYRRRREKEFWPQLMKRLRPQP